MLGLEVTIVGLHRERTSRVSRAAYTLASLLVKRTCSLDLELVSIAFHLSHNHVALPTL